LIAPRRDERHGIILAAVASYSGLPVPMLARSGRLPTGGDYAHELAPAAVRLDARAATPSLNEQRAA